MIKDRLPSKHPLLRYGEVLESDAKATVDRLNKRACHRKFEYEDMASYKAMTSSGKANFDRYRRAVDLYMELTDFKFGYMQEKLEHEIMITFLRHLYGDELLPNLGQIEIEHAITELHDVCAILYPRRAGKTITQTIVAPCIAVSQVVGNTSCYNIGGRQARDWLQQVIDNLRVFEKTVEFAHSVNKVDTREFIQIRTIFGTLNRISSYPGVFQGGANIGTFRLGDRSTPCVLLYY